ncbi:MAG: hypothetical protein P4L81_00710 [Candidatus Pacebacteria bacterium]|nr:hypothetical protein [Candidatus Paceibacterota bacterium]
MNDDEKTVPEDTNKIQQNGLPVPQAASVQPAVSAIPQTQPNSGGQGAPASDFAKILKEIKLPERRDFKATADIKKAAPEPEAAILAERVIKTASAQSQKPAAEQQPIEAPKNERSSSIVSPVRTLKDDLQTVVREQKISLVHAATLEEEKKHGQEHLTPEQKEIKTHKSRRTAGILFASAVLIFLGVGAVFGVYLVMQEQQAIPTVQQSSLLFAEQTLSVPLNNQNPQSLKSILAQARTKSLGSLGSITRIVPVVQATSTSGATQTSPASIAQFFSSLGINPPQELMNSIGPDFFFGFHVVDTNAPLLIIPVTSYDHAFAGMLAWEPNLDADLSPVFTNVSMTVLTNGVPMQRTFQDTVMRNYDVRELTDDSGNVVLYYSFPTPNILVIAQSPYSFTEILSRLQAARKL